MGGINHQKLVVYYCYTHITVLLLLDAGIIGLRQWFMSSPGQQMCEQCSKPLLVDDYMGLYYLIYWGFQ